MTDEVVYTHADGDTLSLSGRPVISWENERTVSKQEGNRGVSNDPHKCLRKVTINSYIATSSITNINRYMRHDEAIDYAATTAVQAAIGDDGGAYTDETTDANDAGATDVVLLPAVPAVNDAFYVGSDVPISGIVFDIGQAGIGTWTITWEYYDSDSWESLQGVNDDTAGFTTTASDGQYVTWIMPIDWATTTINSQGPYYYIRGRVSAYTTVNEQPLADQIYLLGKYPYITVTHASGTSEIFQAQLQKVTVTKSSETKQSISAAFEERTL
jgi:hypothetical protein